MNGTDQFEQFAVDGVTIWRSAGVRATTGSPSATIDLRGLFFLGKRLVVSHAH